LKTKIEIVQLRCVYKVSLKSFKVFSPSSNNSLQTFNTLHFSNSNTRQFSSILPFSIQNDVHYQARFLPTLTLNTSAFALPTSQPSPSDFSLLETRASAKPRVPVSCNGVMIITDYINTAMTQAGALVTVPGGQTAYYPEEYGNNDGPIFAATGQL
jgi:hypothetical protein